MARTKTREAAAKALNVSGETLRKWQYSSWWKPEFHTKAGGYDVDAIKAANPRFRDDDAQQDATDERRRMSVMKAKIDLQLTMSKLKERDRELLPVDKLIEITTRHTQALVTSLDQIPIQLSKLTTDKDTKSKLLKRGRTIVRKLLQTYSQDLEGGIQRLVDA